MNRPRWAIVLLVPALVIFTARSLLRIFDQGDDLGSLTSLSGIVALFGLAMLLYHNRNTQHSVRAIVAMFLTLGGHAVIIAGYAPLGAAMTYFGIGAGASIVVQHARVPAGLAAAGALIRWFDQVKGDAVVVFGLVWLLVMLYTQLEEPTVDEVAAKLTGFNDEAIDSSEE